jgi:L-ascorbate metabolism protein UlaG (beta-lactamase superfamily)
MQVEWYGQSAFRLSDGGRAIVIDPFDATAFAGRGVRWDYPAIEGVSADLLLITHEHRDHNAADVVGGDPALVRSRAGTHDTPMGEVVGVASDHDAVAGTERGHNVMYVFHFAGRRVAHLGDLGQRELRPEQAAALGTVDLLFVPVGDGATIGAEQATDVTATLSAKVIVPMHYRTPRIDFLEPVDAFTAGARHVLPLDTSAFVVEDVVNGDGGPVVVVPATP